MSDGDMDLPEGAKLAGTLQIPDEWLDDREVRDFDVRQWLQLPHGDAVVCTVILDDNTLMWGLMYPGGQRLSRITRDTGWSIEERFEGRPLGRNALDEPLLSLWAQVVEALTRSAHSAREQNA